MMKASPNKHSLMPILAYSQPNNFISGQLQVEGHSHYPTEIHFST
jgi:hypothetical protein